MVTYSINNAVLDIGFIEGCVRAEVPTDHPMRNALEMALGVLDEMACAEELLSPRAIHNVGFIRGALWRVPMSDGYSLAIDRLMEFFVEGRVDEYQLPQPFTGRPHKDPVASDELRDEIYADYLAEGREYAAETARLAGFEEPFVIDRLVPPKVRKHAAVLDERVHAKQVAPPPDASPIKPAPPKPPRVGGWSDEQVRTLTEMKQAGKDNKEIGKAVGRSPRQCHAKWLWVRKSLTPHAEGLPAAVEPPPEVAAEPVEQADSLVVTEASETPGEQLAPSPNAVGGAS